jgi:hypothetical protein
MSRKRANCSAIWPLPSKRAGDTTSQRRGRTPCQDLTDEHLGARRVKDRHHRIGPVPRGRTGSRLALARSLRESSAQYHLSGLKACDSRAEADAATTVPVAGASGQLGIGAVGATRPTGLSA